MNNTSMWLSSSYTNPVMGGTLVGGHFSCITDELVHQYEENWSHSMWKD